MKIQKLDVPFAQVANELLNDPKLSWRAKGIFAYMQSKPDDWDFDSIRMSNDARDGRDGTRKGIKELIEQGYLTRAKLPDGRVEYILQHTKAKDGNSVRLKKPMTEKPSHKKERIYIYGENKLNYLKGIPQEHIIEFTEEFDISARRVQEIADELRDYCLSKGRIYKNYKAFLRNCIRKKAGYNRSLKTELPTEQDYEIVDIKQFRPDWMPKKP